MAITIPSGVFTKYNELGDAMISNFGVMCNLVYPEKRAECTNCTLIGFGGRSTSIYKAGGPLAFTTGMVCPLCEGRGFKITENTEKIRLRVYWNRREWVDVGFEADVPDGLIQTIGYMTDMPKLKKAKNIIVHETIQGYGTMRFTREGSPYPHGFKQDRYAVTFWRRS
jgi:hypothetical protein